MTKQASVQIPLHPAKDIRNILVSTTLGHNVGDRIILQGVKRLLRERFGDSLQYCEYNRNPDLQTGAERDARQDLVGDYMRSGSLLKHMDMVVLAGSPEWFGAPLRALYEAIEVYAPDILLYAIGIGLGHPQGTLTPLDKRILSRPQTKIITRSIETTHMLDKYQINSTAMVCPALFAFEEDLVLDERQKKNVLLILQKPGNQWHEIKQSLLEGVDPSKPFDYDILCVHIKEFEYYSQMFEFERDYHRRVYYAPDVTTFATVVSKYSRVVSTRLHGAIGALSLGVPAVVVSDGDFRIETCSRMFGGWLPIAKSVREALATKTVADQFDPNWAFYKAGWELEHLEALK